MHFNSLPRPSTGRGRPIDEAGKRYGRWTVIGKAAVEGRGIKDTSVLWRCVCDCGNESNVRGWMLRKGASQSCGCIRREKLKELASLPVGEAALNRLIVNMKGNASRRGYAWNLDRETVRQLISHNCFYCGVEPRQVGRARNGDLFYNGLDRVDNNRGYYLDNVVACCNICNTAKSDMQTDQFLLWIERVHRRHGIK